MCGVRKVVGGHKTKGTVCRRKERRMRIQEIRGFKISRTKFKIRKDENREGESNVNICRGERGCLSMPEKMIHIYKVKDKRE